MVATMKRLWWLGLVCLLSLGGSLPAARAGLISEQQELQMGEDAAREVEARYGLSQDTRATTLVETIGKRLAQVSSRPKLPWKFRVLQSKEVNALSVPGYVYINTGLLEFVGNDRDQLAGVIAHEIAHTTRKHAVRQTEKALIGSLALRFLFKDDGSLARNLANMAANLALLGYGRKDELEADRHAADYLIEAGYDPQAMVRFFEQLRAREGKESTGLATYFKTHPPTSERIRKLKEHLAKRGQAASALRHTTQPALIASTCSASRSHSAISSGREALRASYSAVASFTRSASV